MWYVIQVQTRHELDMMKRCREEAAVDGEDIFAIQAERLFRTRGMLELRTQVAFPGYLFAETPDIISLRMRLRSIPELTKILSIGETMTPIHPDEEALLRKLGGEDHIIRRSEGYKEGDRLVVTNGPMKGTEGRVRWTDRHKHMAGLEVDLLGQKIIVKLGVDILEVK